MHSKSGVWKTFAERESSGIVILASAGSGLVSSYKQNNALDTTVPIIRVVRGKLASGAGGPAPEVPLFSLCRSQSEH